MSILYVDFGYDDNVKRELNSLSNKLSSRADDYRGVRNRIACINSNTQNLSQANSFLDKKRNKLDEKIHKISRFKTAVTNFNDYALAADKRVASEIKDSRKSFCKSHGLADGFLYTIGVAISDGYKWVKNKVIEAVNKVKNAAKKAWEWIQDFYEKNKYVIDFAVDVISLAASIVVFVGALGATIASFGTGFPLLLAATWGLSKSGVSSIFSLRAMVAHNKGDEATAEELSGKGMKEVLQFIMGDKVGSIVYHGANIAAFAVSMTSFVKDAQYLRSVDTVSSKWGDVLTPETVSGIQDGGKRLLIKMTTGFDVTKFSGKTVLKDVKWVASGFKGFASKGAMGIFGFGILKDFSGFAKDMVSIFAPSKAAALPY